MLDAFMTYDECQQADSEWLACQVKIVELQDDLEQACEARDAALSDVLMHDELLDDVSDMLTILAGIPAADWSESAIRSAQISIKTLLVRIHDIT